MPVRPCDHYQQEAVLTVGGLEAIEGLFVIDVQDDEDDLELLEFDHVYEADAKDRPTMQTCMETNAKECRSRLRHTKHR